MHGGGGGGGAGFGGGGSGEDKDPWEVSERGRKIAYFLVCRDILLFSFETIILIDSEDII